jgi:hypothetical protein
MAELMRLKGHPSRGEQKISAPAGSRVPDAEAAGAGPNKARPHYICRNSTPRSGGPFGGRVAPGARAGGADGAHLEPVLRAAGQAGDRAARRLADVALGPGSAGGGGLLGDVGLDAEQQNGDLEQETTKLTPGQLGPRISGERHSLDLDQ